MSNFDAKTVKNEVVQWIRDWFEKNGKDCNAVVGISGGKDSSVVAALCVEALGKDRVLGVLMPQGEQSDISYSHMLVEHLGIDSCVVNIGNTVRTLKHDIRRSLVKADIYQSSGSYQNGYTLCSISDNQWSCCKYM